jgi:hypothetical protein
MASIVGLLNIEEWRIFRATPCSRSINALCSDCGTELCSVHAESSVLCLKTFCALCLSVHRNDCAKPPAAEYQPPAEKKTAYDLPAPLVTPGFTKLVGVHGSN